jgi:hypothetical protein
MLHPLPKNVYSLRLVSTSASPLTHQRCCEDRARLVADKLANGKEPKDARRGCAIAIAIMGRRSPGIFRLFAIGALVCENGCAILAAILVWVSGDAMSRRDAMNIHS